MRLAALVSGLAMALLPAVATAEALRIAGREIEVVFESEGRQALRVDGTAVLTDGVVLIDEWPVEVGGVTVVTGLAGPGGTACEAAPFVLSLPDEGDPVLHGPLGTCAVLGMRAGPSALVFTGVATPLEPAEVWVWSPEAGFAAGAPQPFAPDPTLSWERLADLDGEHPMAALRLGQVEAQLQAGLGESWPDYAARISGLGSGALTGEGWLGEACLKDTCDDDWALIYLHARSRSTYAVWAVGREVRLFPPDPGLWPAEAAGVLMARMGG